MNQLSVLESLKRSASGSNELLRLAREAAAPTEAQLTRILRERRAIKGEKAMTVRAKFRVDSISKSFSPKSEKQADGTYKLVHGEVATIKMSPVYSTDPTHENKRFWEASPGGSFDLNCVNPAAIDQFQIGKEYYFDITPA